MRCLLGAVVGLSLFGLRGICRIPETRWSVVNMRGAWEMFNSLETVKGFYTVSRAFITLFWCPCNMYVNCAMNQVVLS